MTLVSRTKETAKLRGLSLKTVATKAGLADNAIYRWDENNPKSENLKKVADVLHVSTDYLLGRTDELNPSSDKPEQVKEANLDDSDLLLAFDGKEIDEEDKQAIIGFLKFRRAQKRNEGK